MPALSSNLAQKVGDIEGTSRTNPNERDGENKYNGSQEPSAETRRKRRRNKKRSLCDRCR